MKTLTVRIEDQLEQRLERLAKEMNRTKSYYVREAIMRILDDMEDVYSADQVMERIREGREKMYDLEEVEARFGDIYQR